MKNWNDLKYFLALAREGSISSASKSLDVNYSTVSRRLNSMEETIATRLFDRLPNGYELTEAGREIYQEIEKIEAQIEEVNRKIMGKDQRLTGAIRLVTSDLLSEKLSPFFGTFLEKYPDIELEVVTNVNTSNMTTREGDLALQITDNPPDYMVGKQLCQVTGAVYCSEHYLAARKRAQSEAHRWIDCESHVASRHLPENARITCRVSSGYGLREAVKNGLGVAQLWSFAADVERSLTKLPGGTEYKQGLWLLIHKDLCRTSRFRVFKDYIEGVIEQLKPELNVTSLTCIDGFNIKQFMPQERVGFKAVAVS